MCVRWESVTIGEFCVCELMCRSVVCVRDVCGCVRETLCECVKWRESCVCETMLELCV